MLRWVSDGRGLAPPLMFQLVMFEGSNDNVTISAFVYIKKKLGEVLGGMLYLQ